MLRKIRFILPLLLLCFVANVSLAQSPEEYKAELKRYLQTSGSDASYTVTMDKMAEMLSKSGIDDSKIQKIKDRVFVNMYDQIVELLAPVYMENISIKDLRAAIKFSESAAGQRIAAAQPKIASETMDVVMKWAQTMGQTIAQIMQEE